MQNGMRLRFLYILKIAMVALVAPVLFNATGSAAEEIAPTVVPGTWSEARKALKNEQWEEAAVYFENRVKSRPNGFIAYYYLGAAYHGMGAYDRALRAHFVAGAYSQMKGPAFLNAARSYAKSNERELALRWLDRALKEGYDNIIRLRQEPDFADLREDRRFEQILTRAARYRDQGMPVGHNRHQTPWDPISDGVEIRTIGKPLPTGTGGVAVGLDGEIYVADFGETLYKISPNGKRKTLATNLKGASGNLVDHAGNVIQAQFSSRKIVRIAPDGEETLLVDQGLSGPVGMALDQAENLYIANCDSHYISRLEPDGIHEVFARSPLLYCPNGIAFDDRGDLYVANFHDGVISRVSANGGVHYVAELPEESAGYLAFVDGVFYVTARLAHRIYKMTRDGDLTVIAGSGARGGADGVGRDASFSLPNALAPSANGNCLYTNDNHRDWRLGENDDAIATTSTLREIRLDPEKGC